MPNWRAAALVSTALALTVAAACSSFETAVDEAPADAGIEAGSEAASDDATAEPDASGGDAARRTRIHVFGGFSDDQGLVLASDAWSADILPDGKLGPWTATPELSSTRYFAAHAVTSNGRLVSAGGSRRVDASAPLENAVNAVETASLDPLTKLTAGAPVEFVLQSPAAASHGAFVYVSGGISDPNTTRNEVFVSSFDGNGTGALLPWSKTTQLGASTARHAIVALGGFMYAAGGGYVDDGGFIAVTETRRSTIAADGSLGPWITTGSLLTPISFHSLVAVKGRLFSIGGRTSSATTDAVYVATPAATGDVTWGLSTPLPTPLAAACAVVANERIVVSGGFVFANGAPVAKVYVGTVGDGGGLSWSEAVGSDLPSARAGHGCAAF